MKKILTLAIMAIFVATSYSQVNGQEQERVLLFEETFETTEIPNVLTCNQNVRPWSGDAIYPTEDLFESSIDEYGCLYVDRSNDERGAISFQSVPSFSLPANGTLIFEAEVGMPANPTGGNSNVDLLFGNYNIVIHPGYSGGALRLERVSDEISPWNDGFHIRNQDMGFTPAWDVLHHIQATVQYEGNYGGIRIDIKVTAVDADDQECVYTNTFFDDSPTVDSEAWRIGVACKGGDTNAWKTQDGIFDNLRVWGTGMSDCEKNSHEFQCLEAELTDLRAAHPREELTVENEEGLRLALEEGVTQITIAADRGYLNIAELPSHPCSIAMTHGSGLTGAVENYCGAGTATLYYNGYAPPLPSWMTPAPAEEVDPCADIEAENQVLTEQVAEFEACKIKTLAEMQVLEDENAALTAQVAEFEACKVKTFAIMADLEEKIASLEGQVATLEASETTLEGQVVVLEAQVVTLEAINDALEAQVTSLDAQVTSLTAQNQTLEDLLAAESSKGNNGHGNNKDGVDVSNPGNSKDGLEDDDAEDDERDKGKCKDKDYNKKGKGKKGKSKKDGRDKSKHKSKNYNKKNKGSKGKKSSKCS